MPDGWTDHDYELSNRYGDNENQEVMAKLISEFTPEIKRGDPSVWKKLDKAVLDITGIDTNVDTILNLAKRKIIKLANSENDPQQRRNIFCEKANKFILEVFDYIKPTSVKMSDYVPPLERDYSSKKYHPKVVCKDVLKGKTWKQIKMKYSVNIPCEQNNETSPEENDMLTKPCCSYTGEPEESEHYKNLPLKKRKIQKKNNPHLKTKIKTANINFSKPSTSKKDMKEKMDIETPKSGDIAKTSSASMKASGNIASNSRNITGSGPSTPTFEAYGVSPIQPSSHDAGVPQAQQSTPGNRLRKCDTEFPHFANRSDSSGGIDLTGYKRKIQKKRNSHLKTEVKTANINFSKPSTSKKDMKEKMDIEIPNSGDIAKTSSESMKASGSSASSSRNITGSGPSASTFEAYGVSPIPQQSTPGNRLRKRDTEVPHFANRSDSSGGIDLAGYKDEQFYANGNDQRKGHWFSTYLKEYEMRSMRRMRERMKAFEEEVKIANQELVEQEKLMKAMLATACRQF